MQKAASVGPVVNEVSTPQEEVLYALQRLENLIHDMTRTVFGPQNIAVQPEAARETIGICDAISQLMTRLESGLDVAHNNLDAIHSALSNLPNKGYKEMLK